MQSKTRQCRCASCWVAAASAAVAASGAAADVITDRAFFDPHPRTEITFETDGDGDPVALLQGQRQAMPAGEYAALGVTFSPDVYWANDGNADFDAAQFLGASPVISIPSSLVNEFDIVFGVHVQAVGMFVANNRQIDPVGPVFTAYDSGGNILEQVTFSAPFHDGSIGVADYGFMGLVTQEPIAYLRVQKVAAIMDDLIFSPVPSPGSATCLGLAGLIALRRRR